MIRVSMQVPEDVFDAIQDTMRQAPKLMQTAVQRRFSKVKRRLLDELSTEPHVLTDADYPLRWKSERQRRFVMAKLRREGNLPYRRTHELARAWRADANLTKTGATITVSNKSPVAVFVQGDWAQPFHLDTGWPQVAEVVVKYEEVLTDQLIDDWYTITDPFAGVTR